MSRVEGYLVVLVSSEEELRPSDEHYRGLYRTPAYLVREQGGNREEEEAALDAYVFGDYTDENALDLIPSLEKAQELLAMFARSPRKFELIYCRSVDDPTAPPPVPPHAAHWNLLGYDVVNPGGAYWSIVADCDQSMSEFLADHLNDAGLFNTPAKAQEYLEQYRHLKLPHYDDTHFEVFEVRLVQNSGET